MLPSAYVRALRPFLSCATLSASRCLPPRAAYHGASQAAGMEEDTYVVDLRSDTLTKPTPAMLTAMGNSTYGDDVFREDPTMEKLQTTVADMFGKEQALFVPTGTMGNLICVLAHTYWERSLEIILGSKSHILMYEQGGISVLGGVHSRQIPNNPDGTFDVDMLDEYVRPRDDPHQPFTALIAVENTHNNCGGKALPLDFLKRLREKADELGLPVHMDGARVMNASVALDVPISEILQYVDSVNMCFSKGIGCPVGSVIAGKSELIERGIRLRKMLGGGMRQSGPLASAALYALEDVRITLKRDHDNAKRLATVIHENGQGVVDIDVSGVHTNIVMINIVKPGLTAQQFCDRLNTVAPSEPHRIVIKSIAFYRYIARIVLSLNMTEEHMEMAERKLTHVLKELQAS